MALELLETNAGSLSGGNGAVGSLLNMRTTSVIVGLSVGIVWTHKSPTSMHLTTLRGSHDSFIAGSTNSRARPSFQFSHA